jgi:general stress protein CsbA
MIISKKFRALGALMIFPLMIGILLTHITVAPSGLPLAIILFVILLWIIYENRARYFGLIK